MTATLVGGFPLVARGQDRTTYESGGASARIDRITWGANDATLKLANEDGFDAYLKAQLSSAVNVRLPAPIEQEIAQMKITRLPLTALMQEVENLRQAAEVASGDANRSAAHQRFVDEMNQLARDSASRHVLRAIYSPNQVLERMQWFWLNHFNVFAYKSNLRAMLGDYEDTIRPRALGRFRELLGAVATHPAMLRYLDNDQNAAGRNNENYARELMELHTLGVDAGYSQHDVQELARVLTGFGVNLSEAPARSAPSLRSSFVRRGLFEFNPNRHDFGAKELLGRPIVAHGIDELDEALDRLARHPATSTFICNKLARYWMSDKPPTRVVAAMAETFRRTDGDIAKVLAGLFDEPVFWKSKKFKDPMGYVLSATRLACENRMVIAPQVLNWLGRFGEPLYGRPTPDGYPLDGSEWSNSGQMEYRFELAKAIGYGGKGLFRSDQDAGPRNSVANLASARTFREWRVYTLSAATREGLAQARSLAERNAFLLASPEFMER